MINQNQSELRRIEHIGLVLILLITIYSLYYPSLFGPFLLDDQLSLRFNSIQAFKTFVLNLDLNGFARERILSRITFLFQTAVLGHETPVFFRFVNIGIHFLNGILLLKILYSLQAIIFPSKKRDALLHYTGIVFFLFHPIQTQAVNYITQRMTLLALLFMLLSIIAYINIRLTAPSKSNKTAQLLILVALIAFSLGSKPTAVVIFPVLLALEFLIFSGRRPTVWVISLASITLSVIIYAFLFVSLNDAPRITPVSYAITQMVVWFSYFKLLVMPWNLALDHNVPLWPNIAWLSLFIACCFHIGTLSLAWFNRKTNPLLALGITITYLCFLPDSLLIPLKDIMAEHRLYFGMIGITIVIVSLMARLRGEKIKTAIFLSLIIALSIATWSRNTNWKTAETIWESNIKVDPRSARAYYQLALLSLSESDTITALTLLNVADSLNPKHALTLSTKAMLATHQGDFILARKLLNRAQDLEPKESNIYRNLGFLAEKTDHPLLAISHYKTACRLSPNDADAHLDLGTAQLKNNQLEDALKTFNQAVSLRDPSARLLNNLGYTYELLDSLSPAKELYLKALEVNPNYRNSIDNLSRVEKKINEQY